MASTSTNRFALLASVDETDSEPQPTVVETVSPEPALNSSAHAPGDSLQDFQPVTKKPKTARKEKQRKLSSTPTAPMVGKLEPNLEAGPAERFGLNVQKGARPKRRSDKWTVKRAAEMRAHKAEAKKRKVERGA